mmetsp:Transcript_78589/g.230574  ORF Transcript_78589/g.230574 Transcript_78589/m.230574 type:complete len:215 (-) Transcript_78589:977-1621(-)
MQKSFFFTSSSCSTFSVLTMWSMAAFTLTKAFSFTDSARSESCGSRARRAAALKAVAACCLRPLRPALAEAVSCTRPYVADMASRAWSCVRISTASVKAWSSVKRAALRCSKLVSAAAQVASRSVRNFCAASSAASSCRRPCLSCANWLFAVASSSSFDSEIFSPFRISSVFAERRASKADPRDCARLFASLRSLSISSLSCLRTPRTSPLCAP